MSPMRSPIDRRSYLTEVVYDPERGDFTERAVPHPFAATLPEGADGGAVPADAAPSDAGRPGEAPGARVACGPERRERVLVTAEGPA
jgi:hypothetical protein